MSPFVFALFLIAAGLAAIIFSVNFFRATDSGGKGFVAAISAIILLGWGLHDFYQDGVGRVNDRVVELSDELRSGVVYEVIGELPGRSETDAIVAVREVDSGREHLVRVGKWGGLPYGRFVLVGAEVQQLQGAVEPIIVTGRRPLEDAYEGEELNP